MPGPLAIVGLSDVEEHAVIDRALLDLAPGRNVVMLPTAAVEWEPERTRALMAPRLAAFRRVFGFDPVVPQVFDREAASDPRHVDAVAEADYVFLGGGRAGPLVDVLAGTPLWQTVLRRWSEGAVLAGESAGGVALTDRVLGDPAGPRGTHATHFGWEEKGFGLVPRLCVVPHSDTFKGQLILAAALDVTPFDVPVIAIPERSAVVWTQADGWSSLGVPGLVGFLEGVRPGLDVLSGVTPAMPAEVPA